MTAIVPHPQPVIPAKAGIQRFLRHARPRAGHPRLAFLNFRQDVDGRVMPGHDGEDDNDVEWL
jgi:hypothetical protein